MEFEVGIRTQPYAIIFKSIRIFLKKSDWNGNRTIEPGVDIRTQPDALILKSTSFLILKKVTEARIEPWNPGLTAGPAGCLKF